MTKREVVYEALSHKKVDIHPYFVGFTAEAQKRMVDYIGDENIDDRIGNFIRLSGYYGYTEPIEGRPGFFRDEFGLVWNRSGEDKDIGMIETPLIKSADEPVTFPPLQENRLRREFAELAADTSGAFRVVGYSYVLFERLWTLLGMEEALVNMALNPEATELLMDKICDYSMKVVDLAMEYDFDGFLFYDDWGQQRGLIMGPKMWRRFFKPRLAKLYDKVHKAGKIVFQHSCGDCRDIMDDLLEIGMDCYQTFQPEIYDPVETKKRYRDKLSVWGGISAQHLLVTGTVDEVKRETKRMVDILGQNGGYIAGPTHSLTHDVPPENVLAMLEVLRQRRAVPN